jgi:hypothetical protein
VRIMRELAELSTAARRVTQPATGQSPWTTGRVRRGSGRMGPGGNRRGLEDHGVPRRGGSCGPREPRPGPRLPRGPGARVWRIHGGAQRCPVASRPRPSPNRVSASHSLHQRSLGSFDARAPPRHRPGPASTLPGCRTRWPLRR